MGALPAASGGPLKVLEGMKRWDKHLQERYYRVNIYWNPWKICAGFSAGTKLRREGEKG